MMRRCFLILVIGVMVGLELSAQSAICAYSYRKRITIDPARVAGPTDFTNFPVLISITSDNNLRTVANSGRVQNSNGFDIIFTSDDGVTRLDFQVERYVATTGQLTAWVKVPLLSTSLNTYLYMYYGNSAIATDQSTVSVWSGYHGVWHLQNNSFTDNAGNGYNYTNNGTTNQSPALINDGRANNGTNWLELSAFPNLTTNYSMSAWIFTSDNTRSGQRVFCDDQNNSGGYALSVGDGGTGTLRFFSRASNPVVLDAPLNTIANNTWYHVVGVADITNQRKTIYVNGVSVATGTFTNAWGTDVGTATAAGENASGETGNRLQGRIDEIRVANTALTASWVATEYNNQSSPSTFYSISTEPNVFTGASSTGWTTNGNWSSGNDPNDDDDVILSSTTNQPNLNTNFQATAIWIRPNTTLTIGNGRTLSVFMDVTNCGVIIGGNNSSELEMNGSNASTATQYVSGSGVYNLRDLIIDNTHTGTPSVVLQNSVDVSSDLFLTSGLLVTTTTNILALGTGASSDAGSATSYVSGPMTKAGTTAFTFPVGKAGRWRRISISAPTASSTFRAEYLYSAFTSTSPVNSPLNNVSTVEFWQLDRVAGTGNASVTLHWENAGASGINNCADLTIARWNGTGWDERAATIVGGSSCAGAGVGSIITNAVVTTFSPFTFGSKLPSVNPLPVELVKFEGMCVSNGLEFSWQTMSESKNDYFRLEYSVEGEEWIELNRIKGKGTTSQASKYNYTELNAPNGYYRLVQVDYDGTETAFRVYYFECAEESFDTMDLVPNPSTSNLNFNFSLSYAYGPASLQLLDATGRVVLNTELQLKKGKYTYTLQSQLPSGIYYANCVTGSGKNFKLKVVITE